MKKPAYGEEQRNQFDRKVPAGGGQWTHHGERRDMKQAVVCKTELAPTRKMNLTAAKAKDRYVKLLHKTAIIQASNSEGLGKGDSSGNEQKEYYTR